MSNEAQAWALQIEVRSEEELRKGGTSGLARKALLMYLANRANAEDGASWPSQTRVARELCCSERCVRDAMRDLENIGLIRRKPRPGTSDLIFINFDYRRPAGDAGVGDDGAGPRRAPKTPAGRAAAGDAGVPRRDVPETPAGESGEPRQDVPANCKDEPSENHQPEPRRSAPWPADWLEQFKKVYPKRGNNDWRMAAIKLEAINQAGDVEFTDIMAGARAYADRMAADIAKDPKNRKYVAMVTTWINQGRWINETPGEDPTSLEAARARIRANKVWV